MNRELKLLNVLLPSNYGIIVISLNFIFSILFLEITENYSKEQFGHVYIILCAIDLVIAIKAVIIKRIFYRVTREKTVQRLVNHFIEYNYPEPSMLGDGNFEWYMLNLIDDEEVDPEIRVDAAKLFATYDAMFPGSGESLLNSSQYLIYSVAVARYKAKFGHIK